MNDMGKPWARADLFFLKDSLERGMSLAEIEGFLRRIHGIFCKIGAGHHRASALNWGKNSCWRDTVVRYVFHNFPPVMEGD
jgi:hypothetical protein